MSERDVAALFDQIPLALVPIPGSVDLLHRLKTAGHTLFCLSNMHAASIEYIERAYSFWELFSGAVVSCRVHMCQPEPSIYAYLLETYRLDAASTVLIDDMQANLDTAAAFGMHTVRFESPAQCENRLAMLRCV
jgi:putative hydrolase of the HAD superfamily